jgi:hypothetical protein
MSRLPIWESHWEFSEEEWDRQAAVAAQQHPLKGLKQLPQMPGITKETAKGLKWKSLLWMIRKDVKGEIRKGFFKHPFKYMWELIKSALKSKPYLREGDFFLYGVDSLTQFNALITEQNSLLVLGFSYCHKPFECPSGRFTPECIRDSQHPVCQQCFIGKALHASAHPQTIPLIIPTIHYIGGKIFEIVHDNPEKQILFIITACEMTLEMFGDWGNMVNIRGLGVRLDGRICNTMKAFELSEEGIKPGLTVVLSETQKAILQFIRARAKALRQD